MARLDSAVLAQPRRADPHCAAVLMFIPHLDAPQAAEHLRNRAAALKATTEKLTRILAELRADGVSRLSLIELEHKIAMLDAERKWVNNLEKEVNDGRLEWKVGLDPDHETLRRRHGARAH